MLRKRLRTWAIAVATMGMVMLGGSKRAAAEIELTVETGVFSTEFHFASDNFGTTGIFSIDGYTLQIQTIVTSYPGSPGNLGLISTTVNILGATLSSAPLVSTVELEDEATETLLPWTAPATSPVRVTSSTSFVPSVTVGGGVATTETFYNSPPAGAGPGTSVVSSFQTFNNVGGMPFNSVTEANTGTYSLSQRLTLTGVPVGSSGINYGGVSTVSAVPEPSSMALAGLGALGLVGYGLRRRNASGA